MNLEPYVESLRDELAVVAEAAGAEARELADRLTGAVASATRLVLLEALSAAADEITRDLAPGSVEVRLRGREPEFVVTAALGVAAGAEDQAGGPAAGQWGPPPVVASEAEDGATSRLNLRLPESLKQRIEEAARQEGLSLNAWLVRAAAAAAESGGRGRWGEGRSPHGGDTYTGWVS